MAKRKKYMVTAEVTISIHTMVVADSTEEALEIAHDRPLVDIIDQGNSEIEWCTSGELDGTPHSLVAELKN